MSKLLDEFTRERLEYYANLPTQPFGEDASVFMYEVRKLARIALEAKTTALDNLPVASSVYGLHPETKDLVDRFSRALTEKLYAAQKKYGYDNTWANSDWKESCQQQLLDHVAKGDPRDVAAYCAFMWHHGWGTAVEVKGTVNLPAIAGLEWK